MVLLLYDLISFLALMNSSIKTDRWGLKNLYGWDNNEIFNSTFIKLKKILFSKKKCKTWQKREKKIFTVDNKLK